MPIITRTIGSGGDYANPAAAASAFNAGTISGATAGDDIVFSIIDNASFASTFRITANPASYLSVTLTAASGVRHNGLPGTGARITRASGNDTDGNALVSCSIALNFCVTWLEIHYAGAGKGSDLISVTENTTARLVEIHHCLLHDSGGVTGFATVRGVRVGLRTTRIHNNIIWNIVQPWALAGAACQGMTIGRATPNPVIICNNTIYNVTNSGSNTTFGLGNLNTFNDAGVRIQNNVVIGTTSAGAKVDIQSLSSYTVAIVSHNASTDNTAIGTGSLTGVTQSIFRNTAAGNLLLSAGASVFGAGTNLSSLVATVPEIGIDITGRDRVANGDTWSMGASQQTNAPTNSIILTSPTTQQIYQRNGANQATVTVAGTYSGTPTSIEYQWAGGSWQTLVSSPSGGAFSATLTLSGGGTFSVRFSNDTAATASATGVGIGDVFVVAGQSNASGRLTSLQTYSHAVFKPSVLDENDVAWRELIDPTDNETTSGSIWPLLATLLMADQGVPCGFITTAAGGTSLLGDWKPTPTTGPSYNGAVNRINAASVNGIAALIWDQGESDANNGASKADYKSALIALLANLQTATSRTFPMICDIVGNGVTGLDPIRQAQIEAADEQANIFLGANSIARRTLHWETNAEGATHAALLWVAMDEALYGGPSARGPRLVSAVTIGGTSTVVLTFDRDLLASDSSYTASAFSVSHSGTARTISSVTRTGNRTVQLSLSGPLDGSSPTVTFASGNSAANATVPRTTAIALPATIQGISSISVPAEPIYAASVTVSAPDTTAPVIAAASVNTAGDTLTVSFTEADSRPLLPSSGATGITLSSTGASVTVSNGTRQSDLVFTFPLSRTVYSNETLLVSYSQASGNITDSAVPTANEVPDTTNFAATNNSTQTPTISSVSTDAIVLVGTASTITWSSAGVIGTVDILLSLDNGATFPITIASATANDGSHAWTPEAAQLTAEGVIRVRSTANNAIQSTRSVKVATTEATGTGSNTAEWAAVREMLVSAGVEVVRV